MFIIKEVRTCLFIKLNPCQIWGIAEWVAIQEYPFSLGSQDDIVVDINEGFSGYSVHFIHKENKLFVSTSCFKVQKRKWLLTRKLREERVTDTCVFIWKTYCILHGQFFTCNNELNVFFSLYASSGQGQPDYSAAWAAYYQYYQQQAAAAAAAGQTAPGDITWPLWSKSVKFVIARPLHISLFNP